MHALPSLIFYIIFLDFRPQCFFGDGCMTFFAFALLKSGNCCVWGEGKSWNGSKNLDELLLKQCGRRAKTIFFFQNSNIHQPKWQSNPRQ